MIQLTSAAAGVRLFNKRKLLQMLNAVSALLMNLLHWIHDNKVRVLILAAISIISFVGTLAAVPFMLIRLPIDYFSHDHKQREPGMTVNPVIRIVALILKNIVGYIIMLAGVIMLLLPGQGILTILAGVMLVDFPGKFHIERRLVSQPKVLQAINWLRLRAGKAQLVIKDEK
jgi:hypothetical protein